MPLVHGAHVTLTAEQAKAALAQAPHREIWEPSDWPKPKSGWKVVQVFYGGQWMNMGRTDLMDNVSTGLPLGHDAAGEFGKDGWPKEPFEYFRQRVRYGARVWQHGRVWHFSVVDSLSDG